MQSLFPHMHLRGELTYFLDQPVPPPKGTQLTATAWFDNSLNNKFNPDPTSEVLWGDQSWEEMLAGFIDIVLPVDMDPAYIARPRKVQTSSAAPPQD